MHAHTNDNEQANKQKKKKKKYQLNSITKTLYSHTQNKIHHVRAAAQKTCYIQTHIRTDNYFQLEQAQWVTQIII